MRQIQSEHDAQSPGFAPVRGPQVALKPNQKPVRFLRDRGKRDGKRSQVGGYDSADEVEE